MDLVYRLLEAWTKAWEEYKGVLYGYQAIPGIVIACSADYIKKGDQTISGGKYWSSEKRAELNQALSQCASAGWFVKEKQPARSLWDHFVNCLSLAWGKYGSGPEWNTATRVLSQYPGLDNEWWSLTLEGKQHLEELKSLALEQKKPPLGYRTQKGS